MNPKEIQKTIQDFIELNLIYFVILFYNPGYIFNPDYIFFLYTVNSHLW